MHVRRLVSTAFAAIVLVLPSSAAPSTHSRQASVFQSIAVAPASFDPTAGETATLHISLVRAGRIELEVIDRDGFALRSLPPLDGIAGENTVTWDGRDNAGEIVPDEAWSFRLRARDGADEWFPAAHSDSAMIGVEPLSFSRITSTLRYKLAVASRVHVQAGTLTGAAASGEGPVLKTVVNREPRGAGFIAEHWNGFDASGSLYVPDLPGFAIAIAATPLPDQSVITFGNARRHFLDYAARRTGRSLFLPEAPGPHHMGLDVFHDVAPSLRLTFLDTHGIQKNPSGVQDVVAAPVRIRVEAEGPTATGFQSEPGKVFVFVDSRLAATVDAREAANAIAIPLPDDREHRIAVNWRSDYGPVAVAVARVRLVPGKSTGSE